MILIRTIVVLFVGILQVRERVRKEHRHMCLRGDAFVTHRVTQLYPEGACVYFYLAIYAQVGVVWCGLVWFGIVWYCMVWYGMLGYYSLVWYVIFMVFLWYGRMWCDMTWYGSGVVLCDVGWYRMLLYGMVNLATYAWWSWSTLCVLARLVCCDPTVWSGCGMV